MVNRLFKPVLAAWLSSAWVSSPIAVSALKSCPRKASEWLASVCMAALAAGPIRRIRHFAVFDLLCNVYRKRLYDWLNRGGHQPLHVFFRDNPRGILADGIQPRAQEYSQQTFTEIVVIPEIAIVRQQVTEIPSKGPDELFTVSAHPEQAWVDCNVF